MTEEMKKYEEIFERGQSGGHVTRAESNFIARLHYEDTKNKIEYIQNLKS